MNFQWVNIYPETTISADGSVPIDMQTRPKSALAIRFSCLNNAAKATFAQLLGALEAIKVELFGSSFINLSGNDLAALNQFLLGRALIQENVIDTDNATRSLVLLIPFGRRLGDREVGLWTTSPEEAKLVITVDIADTGYDGLILNVAALEMPDARFTRCLRTVTLSSTPTATGQWDVELPRTHPTLAYILFSTTVHTGTAWTTTVDKVELLEDNNPERILSLHWELLHGLSDLYAEDFGAYNEKIHLENSAANYTQNADTAAEEAVDNFIENYAFLDMCLDNKEWMDTYDPTKFTDLKLRVTAGDTNILRVIPLEYMFPRR